MPADVLEKAARVEEALHEVSKIGSIVTDVVEHSVRSATQAIRHGRYAAEDAIEEAKHTVKGQAEAITGDGHSLRCRSLGREPVSLDWITSSSSAAKKHL